MSYLGNDAINRVTLHSTVQALAQGAGGVFVFVYLLKAGVAIPLVLCALAGMSLGRFAMRPVMLSVARRHGLRATLMLGTVLEAAIFPLLPSVHGPGVMLLIVIGVSALGSVLYWTSLHAYFAALGDAEHRGRQVGVRAAAIAVTNIVAPWFGGWALTALGATSWPVRRIFAQSHPGGGGQRAGDDRGHAARTGNDGARLQPRQSFALSVAFPHGDRGRVGSGLHRRQPHGGHSAWAGAPLSVSILLGWPEGPSVSACCCAAMTARPFAD